MKMLLITAAAIGLAGPAAASDKVEALATVTKYFTATDFAAAAKLCTKDANVIDDFAPHAWHSCADWAADYLKMADAAGIKPGTMVMGKPRHVQIDGDTAYIVTPATYNFTEKDKPMVHKATVTASLKKAKGAWLITGWAWGND